MPRVPGARRLTERLRLPPLPSALQPTPIHPVRAVFEAARCLLRSRMPGGILEPQVPACPHSPPPSNVKKPPPSPSPSSPLAADASCIRTCCHVAWRRAAISTSFRLLLMRVRKGAGRTICSVRVYHVHVCVKRNCRAIASLESRPLPLLHLRTVRCRGRAVTQAELDLRQVLARIQDKSARQGASGGSELEELERLAACARKRASAQGERYGALKRAMLEAREAWR